MPPATFKKRRQKEKKGVNARLQQVDADSPSAGTTSDAEGQPVWKLPNQALEMCLTSMESLPFTGFMDVAVLDGTLRVLGAELHAPPRPDEEPAWHSLESPAGGLPIALQTPSAVSSPARFLLRAAAELPRGGDAAPTTEALSRQSTTDHGQESAAD